MLAANGYVRAEVTRSAGRAGMIPALDIWRAAQLMMKHHGEDAAIQAGMRVDELLAE